MLKFFLYLIIAIIIGMYFHLDLIQLGILIIVVMFLGTYITMIWKFWKEYTLPQNSTFTKFDLDEMPHNYLHYLDKEQQIFKLGFIRLGFASNGHESVNGMYIHPLTLIMCRLLIQPEPDEKRIPIIFSKVTTPFKLIFVEYTPQVQVFTHSKNQAYFTHKIPDVSVMYEKFAQKFVDIPSAYQNIGFEEMLKIYSYNSRLLLTENIEQGFFQPIPKQGLHYLTLKGLLKIIIMSLTSGYMKKFNDEKRYNTRFC